jgi:hypothetical protein
VASFSFLISLFSLFFLSFLSYRVQPQQRHLDSRGRLIVRAVVGEEVFHLEVPFPFAGTTWVLLLGILPLQTST